MGFIKEHSLIEQAHIADINEKEVIVYTREGGNIPHIHILNPQDKTFECCVRLDKAEYFCHGNKQNTLNTKDKKEFVACMNKSTKTRVGHFTNWEIAVLIWNQGNSQAQISDEIKMPNYLQLK